MFDLLQNQKNLQLLVDVVGVILDFYDQILIRSIILNTYHQ